MLLFNFSFPFVFFLSAVKHDCVFGDDLDVEEITFVSEVLTGLWYNYSYPC